MVKKIKKIERLRRYWADMIRHTEIMSSRQTFTDILNLFCDPDLEHSNPNFPQDSLAQDAVLSNQVWLQTNQHFRRYNRNSHILIISPRCDLDNEVSEPLFLHDTLAYDGCCITMPGLVTKYSPVQKILYKKTFTYILNIFCDLDLEYSNSIVFHTVLSNQVWLQMDQQFRFFHFKLVGTLSPANQKWLHQFLGFFSLLKSLDKAQSASVSPSLWFFFIIQNCS